MGKGGGTAPPFLSKALGHLHGRAALPPGKYPPVPTGEEVELASDPVCTLWRGDTGNRTPVPQPSSPLLYRLSHHGSYISVRLSGHRSQIKHITSNPLCQRNCRSMLLANSPALRGGVNKSRLDYKLTKIGYMTTGRSLALFLLSAIKHHFRLQSLRFILHMARKRQPYTSRIWARRRCTVNVLPCCISSVQFMVLTI
jgi:hypothetical protein